VVYNVGGGAPVELCDAIALLGELLERPVEVERLPAPIGEAWRTGCDGALARRELGFTARTTLAEGLAAQLEWTLAARGRRREEAVAA
jgi:UDP-glucuronate 4-epimerase